MEKPTGAISEGLLACVNALRVAAQSLRSREPGAEDAIRRLCRSLRLGRNVSHHPEVLEIVGVLEKTQGPLLENALQKFLPRLRDIAIQENNTPCRILCVEDDLVAQAMLQKRLGSPTRQIVMAGSLAQARALLAEDTFSLILIDLSLPDGDGRDLLLDCRQNPVTAMTPVIILTGEQGNQATTECVALGADEFVSKPFDPVRLYTVVASELQRAAERNRLSSMDPLTGLLNRAAFGLSYTRARQLMSRSGQSLVIGLLDIDHFKFINDRYGHAMGDQVLRRLASVVPRCLRSTDVFARWGGEEFALLLPQSSVASAQKILTHVLEVFHAKPFTPAEGADFQVSFSAGISTVQPQWTVEDAIADADRYLYQAKATGRHRVVSSAP